MELTQVNRIILPTSDTLLVLPIHPILTLRKLMSRFWLTRVILDEPMSDPFDETSTGLNDIGLVSKICGDNDPADLAFPLVRVGLLRQD